MPLQLDNMGPNSNEELLNKLREQMYKDQVSLFNNPYPVYRGETFSPMSASTQKARQLRTLWENQPAPYSNKINQVVNRGNTGFSNDQLQNLLRLVGRTDVSQNLATERLNKQFGRNFGYEQPREQRIRNKIGQDITRTNALRENNLRDLSDQLGIVEGKRNTKIGEVFNQAGEIKKTRRGALINQLEEFGNQNHAFNNLKNTANRNAFYEEVNAPYNKIARTESALQGINFNEMHPSKLPYEQQKLEKIINSYNTPYQPYPGKRVVDVHPETEGAWNLTNSISPKYRDQNYNERKNLERDMLQGDNLPTKIYNKIPEGLNPLMANIDELTRQQLKKESQNIGGKHVRLGTYGSNAHKSETEKSLRDILRLVQAEREGALLSTIKGKATAIGGQEENNLNRYNQLSGLGGQEFLNMLEGHKNMANAGNKKWANEQEQENNQVQAWYSQVDHTLPVVKEPSLRFTAPQPVQTNLNEIFSRPAPHSEIVRAPVNNNPPINNQQNNQEALRLQNLRNQQLEQQRLQNQRLEQQRLEQERLQNQRLEQQRLEQQRYQQQREQEILRRQEERRQRNMRIQNLYSQRYNQIVMTPFRNGHELLAAINQLQQRFQTRTGEFDL